MKLSRDQIKVAVVGVVAAFCTVLLFQWLDKRHLYDPSHELIGIASSLGLLVCAYSEKRKDSLGYIALGMLAMVVLIDLFFDSLMDSGMFMTRPNGHEVLKLASPLLSGFGVGAILHSWMLGTLLHRQPGLDLAPESPANEDRQRAPGPPVRNRKLLRTVTIVFGLALGVGLAVLFAKVKWKIGGDIVLFAISALLFGAFSKLRREGDSRKTTVLIMAVSALLCAVISVVMDVPELLRNYPRARPLLNAARTMIIGLGIGAMVNEHLCKVVTARRRGTINLAVEPSQS